MSEHIVNVTDASFEQDVLRPTALCWWTTGPSGAVRAR